MQRRHELSDTQWEKIGPLLPGKAGDPGRHGVDNRLFVNAVLYVARTGVPWRDLPERFGRWNSVWRRFDRWCVAGVWQTLAGVPGAAELAGLQPDSTSVKAQHSAAGARRRPGEKKTTPTRGGAWAGPAGAGPASSTRR